MVTLLLVIAGAVFVAALAITAHRYISNGADNEAVIKRCLARREQRIAEAHMQRVMQDTVEQMFKAVRNER